MARACSIGGVPAAWEPSGALPRPRELAALGTVACLYPAQPGGELAGWCRAHRAVARSVMDSDGLQASLDFHDGGGGCCWRLFLLPDSDFLAWERLASRLPAAAPPAAAGIADRLWRGLAGRLGTPRWQCSVLRLDVSNPGPGFAGHALLSASLATVSDLGAAMAERIARQHAAGNAAQVHECCCERAARVSPPAVGAARHRATPPPDRQSATRIPS
ncbi:Hemin transport protein [Luteimonas sp. RD2P54]|uniref:Hemin transport protein n=1 Tax=Luteimonas endophytica TaxID=3042023 RepID=A0ABT6J9S6_9GAMM|nr:Hemin transport protein [Luteimonas endophytica]MDH5822953.1 Hemin transport protein [Luteimonas endophytica]